MSEVVARASDTDVKTQGYFPMDVKMFGPDNPHLDNIYWIVRLDKLLAAAGLADSATDGVRKIRARSVQINGDVVAFPKIALPVPFELTIRVGRLLRKVRIL